MHSIFLYKKRNFFTLAEVLITLAVIGIVAAISIPSLQSNIDNKQNIAAWKKMYSVISNATNMIIKENGGTLQGACGVGNTAENKECYRELYKKYLNSSKECDGWTTGCWKVSKRYDNGEVIAWANCETVLTLADGTIVCFTNTNGCPDKNTKCLEIWTDVNGLKGPNRLGYDHFYLNIVWDRASFMTGECNDWGGACSRTALYK